MTKVYSYRRFSTTGKQSRGDSTRRQTEFAIQVAEQKGWTLDTSLTFADSGVSAFHGKNSTSGELAKFLAAIESGKIKSGEGLIVESLDRISREKPLDAFDKLKAIIGKGVFVHTAFDGMTYTVESLNSGNGQVFILFGILQRAHEESQAKSIRATKSWENKQTKAANEGKAFGRNLPAWIRLDAKGQMELHPERAAIMQEVIRLGITGMGAHAIVKKFHTDHVPTWRKAGRWDVTRMKKIMTTRMLLGEYQPCRNRQAFGEPVVNFYPAVCTEAEFYQLQSVIGKRKRVTRGRQGKTVSNLFGGMAVSGDDGSVMRVNYQTKDTKRFISVDCLTGANPNFISFPYQCFETAFLRQVAEISLTESTSPDLSKIAELDGRLAAIRAKIDQTQAAGQTATGKAYDRILQMLPGLEAQEQEIITQLETAKALANRPAVSTADVAALVKALEAMPDDQKQIGREKLRGAIQGCVEKIEIYIRRSSSMRNATAVLLAVVTMRDGLSRFIVIRKAGKTTYTVGVNKPFQPLELNGRKMADLMIENAETLSNAEFNGRTVSAFLMSERQYQGGKLQMA